MASLNKNDVLGLVTNLGNALQGAGQSVRNHPYVAPPRAVKADVEVVLTERVEDAVNGIGSLHTALVGTSTDLATRTTERNTARTEVTRLTPFEAEVARLQPFATEVTRLQPFEAEVTRLNPLLAAQDAEVRRLTPLYNTASGEVTRLTGEVTSLTTDLGTANSRVTRVVKERNFGIGGTAAVAAVLLLWAVFGGSSDPSLIATRDAAIADRDAARAQLATAQQDLANLRATAATHISAPSAPALPAAPVTGGVTQASVDKVAKDSEDRDSRIESESKQRDGALEGRIVNLETKMTNVEGKLSTIEAELNRVKRYEEAIATLKVKIEKLEANPSERERLQVLVVQSQQQVNNIHQTIQRAAPAYQPTMWRSYCRG